MEKVCKFCGTMINEQNMAVQYKKGSTYIRNECKPCRVTISVNHKRKTLEEKQVPCEICSKACIKKFIRSFCSLECHLLGYIKKTDSCWIWIGSIRDDGYGKLHYKGKETRAHRLMFSTYKEKIKPGLLILHSCHNTKCVNPDHLRQGTVLENSKDMIEARRSCRGSQKNTAKLTEDKVKEIRYLRDLGLSQQSIAEKFDVSQVAIGLILRRKTWKHVE